MNTFNNKPEKWAQGIEIKQKERPMKLQRDQTSYCYGLFIKALGLCRDDVNGNSNENLDLYDNEFEEEGMANDDTDDKCDENDNDYFYNQF